MKLSEKIYTCRKKAGLSQDALAEQIGVSRQAISKWENGEAVPETSKLPGLAKALGVSIDWLLSEEEENDPVENHDTFQKAEADPHTDTADTQETHRTEEKNPLHELDWLPGFLMKLVRRYGWLAGVYVAVGGLGTTLIGAIAKAAVRGMVNMANTMDPFGGSLVISDSYGNEITGDMAEAIAGQLDLGGYGMTMRNSILENNPVSIVAGVLLVIGILTMLCGIGLAVWLYQKRGEE